MKEYRVEDEDPICIDCKENEHMKFSLYCARCQAKRTEHEENY